MKLFLEKEPNPKAQYLDTYKIFKEKEKYWCRKALYNSDCYATLFTGAAYPGWLIRLFPHLGGVNGRVNYSL